MCLLLKCSLASNSSSLTANFSAHLLPVFVSSNSNFSVNLQKTNRYIVKFHENILRSKGSKDNFMGKTMLKSQILKSLYLPKYTAVFCKFLLKNINIDVVSLD